LLPVLYLLLRLTPLILSFEVGERG
jgi:hypothetical protein